MTVGILTVALCLASSAFARTNLQGCTYYDSVIKPSQQAAYATRLWYVPDSGEVCKLLDCGGGRAPPKTTVPGCPQYEGTETYSPLFIDPKTLGQAVATGGIATTAAPATTNIASIASATSIASTTSVVSVASSAVETSAPASWSAKSAQSGSTSGSATGSDRPTSTSTGAAGSLVTGAALAPCLVAGVAAGLGLF